MKSRIFKIGAILLALIAPAAAYALSVNSNYTPQVRNLSTQQVHYYRFTLNYNDANVGAGLGFAKLSQNTFIERVACHVQTAFNAGSTNVFTLGYTQASANEIITASGSNSSVNEASPTFQDMTASPGLGIGATSPSDITLYAKYAQTGTPATAGQVTCIVAYIPPGDFQ